MWEQPDKDSGIEAMQVSIAIRDTQPERFLDAHHALFEHRHAAAGDLRSREVLTDVLAAVGVDTEAAWAEVDSGRSLATFEKEHAGFVESHEVWGVPTFIVGDRAVFVRLLEGPNGDVTAATTHDRTRARPPGVGEPQRVQAHEHPTLTGSRFRQQPFHPRRSGPGQPIDLRSRMP